MSVPRLSPSSTDKTAVLLEALCCYCFRGGRSNAATIGRLLVVNMLCKLLADLLGSSAAANGSGRRVSEVKKRNEVKLKTVIANSSLIHQILLTIIAVLKWRKC